MSETRISAIPSGAMWGLTPFRFVALVLLQVVAACATAIGHDPTVAGGAAQQAAPVGGELPSPPPQEAAPSTAAPEPAAPEPAAVAVTEPAPAATAAPRPRVVHDQPWTPFAVAEGLVLRHPSARVERIGFHEANHDGARQLEPLATAAAPVTLESRERGTGSRTAADVVVDPSVEIRAPVTGRVLRAGTYVLYCDHTDDYAVIEPDDRPGWEVKVLHIDGLVVRPGDRVEAGVTVLAAGPTPLPFESQVDEVTAQPAWPHVHIEVVDPTIPDRPSPGGGSSSC